MKKKKPLKNDKTLENRAFQAIVESVDNVEKHRYKEVFSLKYPQP